MPASNSSNALFSRASIARSSSASAVKLVNRRKASAANSRSKGAAPIEFKAALKRSKLVLDAAAALGIGAAEDPADCHNRSAAAFRMSAIVAARTLLFDAFACSARKSSRAVAACLRAAAFSVLAAVACPRTSIVA